MIGIVLRDINIRSEMRVTPTNDVGDLKTGDVVIGTVLAGWIEFDKVYRKASGQSQAEPLGLTRYAAVQDPSVPATKYMMLVDANVGTSPVPSPLPTLPTLDIAIGGNEYETVNVELKPKA